MDAPAKSPSAKSPERLETTSSYPPPGLAFGEPMTGGLVVIRPITCLLTERWWLAHAIFNQDLILTKQLDASLSQVSCAA